jgi:hypothetical protein
MKKLVRDGNTKLLEYFLALEQMIILFHNLQLIAYGTFYIKKITMEIFLGVVQKVMGITHSYSHAEYPNLMLFQF